MKRNDYRLQLFAGAATNTTVSGDLEPAISIDFTSRIQENIDELRELLGVAELIPMSAGTDIKIYELTKENAPAQVAEGVTIPLTEIKRKLKTTISITLDKYRKNTTAEAIQKVGRSVAVNMTDEKLISEIQKDVKKSFYTALGTGTGTATGTSLQTTLANLWASLQTRYEDLDVSPIYFINPQDVADYLGSAQLTMQTAFGFTYVENFLGLGTAVISPQVPAKSVYATAKENINGAYVPISGDIAQTFDLTYDESGTIGMTHQMKSDNATIDTLVMSCVKFFPEYADGVFKGTISAAS